MELIAIQVTFNDVYILRSQVNSLAGFVFGGDVLRLFHGDECLTIPPRETDNVHKYVFQVSTLFYLMILFMWSSSLTILSFGLSVKSTLFQKVKKVARGISFLTF